MLLLVIASVLMAGLLYWLLPHYVLSCYRRYRGDPYWQVVRPYKKRYAVYWVPLLFLASTVPLLSATQWPFFYLFFSAILLSLAWLDLKLRILPDVILLLFALLGLTYSYVVADGIILRRLLMVLLCVGCAKIVQIVSSSFAKRRCGSSLGAGDIKFMAALACWFEMMVCLYLVALACVIALVAIFFQTLLFKRRVETIAFGPYLSLAAYFVWWWGSLYS